MVLMVLWNQQTPTSRLVAEDLLQPAGPAAQLAALRARPRRA